MSAATLQLHEPDLDLLRRFTDTGDSQAFAEIVRRYSGVVYSASKRILNDEGRAQDVSQETFYRLLRQPRLVTHSLGGWLHRSATHLAIDAKRSELSRRQREKTYWLSRESERAGEPKWEDISPYVDQALNELEEPHRTLLIRHFLQGVSQSDLAADLELSPATISRKIKTGTDRLQKQLQKKGIFLGLAALSAFCVNRTAEAAPAQFLLELGKMRLISSIKLAPPIPPSPAAHYPSSGKIAAKAETRFALLATAAGVAVLALIFFAGVMSWGDHSDARPPQHEPETSRTVVAH